MPAINGLVCLLLHVLSASLISLLCKIVARARQTYNEVKS